MHKCSVIIPSYNEAENLKKCLESLQELDYPKENFEIIVIDNNSRDETARAVESFPGVTYLLEKNQGAAFARNAGIRHAKNDILVFLDADTLVSKEWLSKLLSPFDDENIGAVGGEIRPFKEGNIFSNYLSISFFMRYHRYGPERKVKGYPSCNLAVRKKLILEGFDTSSFRTYAEDKDVCYRIIDHGYSVVFKPGSFIYHHHPDSWGKLLNLWKKSSEGRARFSEKYKLAPDALIMNFHLPLIYIILIAVAVLLKNFLFLAILILPPAVFFIHSSISAFLSTKKFALSFFIKPLFDIMSIYVIYFWFHMNKIRR